MKKKSTYHFRKTLRRYRNLQLRLQEATSPAALRQLSRKLDLLGRRLLRLNRSWKLGIATAALMAWMTGPVQGQVFPASFSLDSLDNNTGVVIQGMEPDAYSGIWVSGLGDINGDGMDDVIIGAPATSANGQDYAGESYVVFGSDTFADTLAVSELDGSNGFVINGLNEYAYSGLMLSKAGDLNGDGINDIAIGASGAGTYAKYASGQTYVIFGGTSFPDTLNLSRLTDSIGLVINGVESVDYSGKSVRGAGDVNGDGMDDLIIGAPFVARDTNVNVGESYVVFGTPNFGDTLELSDLNGSNGFVIPGSREAEFSGIAVNGLGDVNGDGIDDIMLANYRDFGDSIETYVVFGANTFNDTLDLSTLNGMNGFVTYGLPRPGLGLDWGVPFDGAGDVNGDGIDDFIMGSPYDNDYAGVSYVVFGSNAFGDSLFLPELARTSGNNGFVLSGKKEGDFSGAAVAGAGDINGDGMDDVVIGAPTASPDSLPNVGETYVVFGQTSFPGNLFLSALDGNRGFTITGANAFESTSFAVNGAGDVNGDGIDDLIMGGIQFDSSFNAIGGVAYLFFGRDLNASLQALRPSLALEVVPNPTAGTLYLQAEPFGRAARVEIRLYDLMGREVAAPTQQVSSDRYQLDLQALPAGTYLLRAMADGEVGTSRVVKE